MFEDMNPIAWAFWGLTLLSIGLAFYVGMLWERRRHPIHVFEQSATDLIDGPVPNPFTTASDARKWLDGDWKGANTNEFEQDEFLVQPTPKFCAKCGTEWISMCPHLIHSTPMARNCKRAIVMQNARN